ncbi:hypothetical protein ACFQGT_02310 [Natrialbaceae archaeon GCM10025810]|uniref:DUF7533 family protein n=1 Tax=Halovalidus salilacus TaxID=3075124 RepID=UPI0036170978
MAGIIDTIKLAGVLVFAIPAALAGLEFLLVQGRTLLGAGLLGVAVALVVIQHRLTVPTDVTSIVLERVTGAVVKEPDPDDEE